MARKPLAGGARVIQPVMVFQPQQDLTGLLAIEHDRASLFPWPRKGQAFVALHRGAVIHAGQGQAATVAAQAENEGHLRPAGRAERAMFLDQRIAAHALRRVDRSQRGLCPADQAVFQLLHFQTDHLKQALTMTQSPPDIADRTALARNRARAGGDLFLHDLAREELQLRLSEVNRRFTQPAVICGLPQVWGDFLPGARVVADDPVLALERGAHDLVIHAMSLHWASDPVGQLVQARHALRPDGLFLAVLPGGQTLAELRAALAQAEVELTGGLSPRVLPMAELRDLGALLQRAGFALPVADVTSQQVQYRALRTLFGDLRAMGEQNALAARRRNSAPRRLFDRAAEIYAAHFADPAGLLRATFDLVFLTGWAPAENQPKPLRPGSAQTRLADALGATERPLRDPPKPAPKD